MLGIPTDSPQCPRAEALDTAATETPTPTPISGPTISFDFYRAGDVTGGRYTCYVPSSSVRIEKLMMATTIYFSDGRVSRFNSGPIDGGFDRDCPRSIDNVRPHEVEGVHAQVFSLEERIRHEYYCTREESDFSGGYFPCNLISVSDPLPAITDRDHGLFRIYRRTIDSSLRVYVVSKIDIAAGGISILSVKHDGNYDGDRDELWPNKSRIPKGVHELLAGAYRVYGADFDFGFVTNAETGVTKGVYCDQIGEEEWVCDGWTIPPSRIDG